MGWEIDPDDDEWQPCPDCTDTLPATIHCRLLTLANDFTGTLTQDPFVPSDYEGTLWDGIVSERVFCVFCFFPGDATRLACRDDPTCTGREVTLATTNCFITGSGKSWDGTHEYWIAP